MLGSCFFSDSHKFCGSSNLSNLLFQRRSSVKETGSTLNNSMEGSVAVGMVKELGFPFPSIVFEKLRICDGIDIHMSGGSGGRLLVEEVMVKDISSVRTVEVSRLV